jgi:c-di-GMP-binding flagellar brake protein YcgR
MALTTQTFSEIIGCGTNVRTDARDDDRRRDLRVPLRVQASIVPLSGRISGKPTRARIQDLSLSGAGLLCDKPVEAGEALALRLERQGMDAVWVRCRIVRCYEVEPRLFLIGVEFTDVIDLKALMGRTTPAADAAV